eukprot:CAMPEP_0114237924 /NCGR_PEP_ID=MMETSP0058-20121206/7651_1 /TAXON_ID=36894 /ORGANISM="Pyramimonas parkeae, CCMP726" /LENGTH=78 /DNA_ID=CAMNT_0001350001 /DNA_START=296 /DNA_END=528 /DNA_ORIENTATION=-
MPAAMAAVPTAAAVALMITTGGPLFPDVVGVGSGAIGAGVMGAGLGKGGTGHGGGDGGGDIEGGLGYVGNGGGNKGLG